MRLGVSLAWAAGAAHGRPRWLTSYFSFRTPLNGPPEVFWSMKRPVSVFRFVQLPFGDLTWDRPFTWPRLPGPFGAFFAIVYVTSLHRCSAAIIDRQTASRVSLRWRTDCGRGGRTSRSDPVTRGGMTASGTRLREPAAWLYRLALVRHVGDRDALQGCAITLQSVLKSARIALQ